MALYLRVFKSELVLEVWDSTGREHSLVEAFTILAWSGELGPKLVEGDLQAPEGFYEVTADSLNSRTKFHRSFDLGFPNEHDRSLGRTGSHLMVHGGSESVGCHAIGDEAIERLYAMVEAATADCGVVPVHCFPFRVTPENLAVRGDTEWIDFWRDLARTYLWFEETRTLLR